mgnify:CR=1 FL=1
MVLVVVQGKDSDEEVVSMACSLATRRRASLRGLFVLEVPWTVSLGAWDEEEERRGRSSLEAARAVAARYGCGLQGKVLPTRHAGQAILEEAAEWCADTIVMASPHPSREGDAVSYVLQKATCSVLVWQGKTGPGPCEDRQRGRTRRARTPES